MTRLVVRLIHGLCVCGLIGSVGARTSGAAAVDRYLGDDVVAVASVDLTRLDLLAAFEGIAQFGVVPQQHLASERQHADEAQQLFAELPKAGARRAYALGRPSDLQFGGATFVIELAADAHPARVVDLLKSWLELARRENSFGNETAILPREVEAADGVVLAASTPEQMKLLKESNRAGGRPDAASAMERLSASDLGLVVFGNADTRRVMREMFPQMPAPFTEINGRLLADGVKWGGLLAKLPPTPEFALTIEAMTPEVAATLEESATKGLTLLKGLCMAEMVKGTPEAAMAMPLLGMLQPKREDARVTISMSDAKNMKAAFAQALLPAVRASQEAARRATRVNNFKQIALGMLNYESAKGTLPPPAIYDLRGKPLLSWRVLILPFMEQQELYSQFHLDEPWDSEHNRALIAKMPDVYRDPESGAPEGHTTFVVPVTEGTAFADRGGTKVREIIDGTANTILAVDVIPELAVPWTKPDDWQVDLTDPLRGVRRNPEEGRGGAFTAAFGDGHVQMINANVDPGVLKAMLTISGKEPVPVP